MSKYGSVPELEGRLTNASGEAAAAAANLERKGSLGLMCAGMGLGILAEQKVFKHRVLLLLRE